MAERSWTSVNNATPRWAQLGQIKPADTTATSIYSPGTNVVGFVRGIIVVNNTTGAIVAKLYWDANGTTYDTTTLIVEKSIAADDYLLLTFDDDGLPMPDSAGNIAGETATGNALTFTAWGKELIFNA